MIALAVGIAVLFALLYVAFRIGEEHGKHVERSAQLERLKKHWDELEASLSDMDTLDDITVPVRFTGHRDHTIN